MNDEKAHRLYQRLEEDGYIQNLIAQGDSRYLLFNVSANQDDFPSYTEKLDEKLTQIAFSYLSIGTNYAENGSLSKAIIPLDKGAAILETVHSPFRNRSNYSSYFVLASSLAYYAAQQYSKSFTLLSNIDFGSQISKLISYFLKRQYNELQVEINNILLSDNYTDRTIASTEDDLERVYVVLLSKSLSTILEYIYSGEEVWLSKSEEIIEDLTELVSLENDPGVWWVLRLFKLIFKGFNNNSFWKVVPPYLNGGGGEVVKEYIRSMAFQSTPVVELFNSQKEALPKVLSSSGAVVCLPTSSGKTRIAELAILNCLLSSPDNVVLYLAPFRSLAYEIEDTLSKIFRPLGYEVSHLYGGGQFSKIDEFLIDKTNIIIATPEKAKAIVRSNSEVVSNIKLVVVDEGHLLGTNNRYTSNEIFIEELRYYINENDGKMILLSAVLPNGEEIAKWITGDRENIVSNSQISHSSQRTGYLFFKHNKQVNLQWQGELESFNPNFVDSFTIQRPRSQYHFPNNKKEGVASVAVKLTQIGSVLIFVARKNMVISQAKEVLTSMRDNPTLHNWKNKVDWDAFSLTCEEAFGTESEVLKFAKYGILCHHAGLPTEVRITMEKLMRRGKPKIIIATTTLGQGVNIGVSTVIFANVWIDGSTKISTNDFWNISGRAGRTFVDREGKILYALDGTKPPGNLIRQKRLADSYFQKQNQRSVYSGLLVLIKYLLEISIKCGVDFDLFLQLIAENDFSQINSEYQEDISSSFDFIDDTLLDLSERFQSYDSDDKTFWVDEFFRKSLAYINAEQDNEFDESNLISLLKARSHAVQEIAGDYSNWKELISTAIPIRSARAIKEQIEELLNIVKDYNNSDNEITDLIYFLKRTEEIISELPSQQFHVDFDPASIEQIREDWLMGKPLSEIPSFSAFKHYFTLILPWGINAISKILHGMDREKEAEVYENLSLLVQVGLPDRLALKVYLAGVQSRRAALELSKNMPYEELNDKDIREIRTYITMSKINNDKLSDSSKKWISVIKENIDKLYRYKDKLSIFKFEQKVSITNDQLLVKEYEDNIYLCSPDFEDKLKVPKSKELPFENFSNDNGIIFTKVDSEDWEMNIRNPFIKDRSKKGFESVKYFV